MSGEGFEKIMFLLVTGHMYQTGAKTFIICIFAVKMMTAVMQQ